MKFDSEKERKLLEDFVQYFHLVSPFTTIPEKFIDDYFSYKEYIKNKKPRKK